jgi:N,N'-diacetyllegionaminate synthase
LNVSVFKVLSGEITNIDLQERIGAKRKPVTLSTGMAILGQIEQAMRCLSQFGAPQIALLQFVSEYPADVSKANLRAIATLTQCFGLPVGLSDHSLGIEVAIAAL